MSLLEKMQKAGPLSKLTSVLNESPYFNRQDFVPTKIPSFNIALSGELNGGISPGLTVIAGQSKTFKTLMGLLMVQAYMEKYPDAICLFYVNEFGATQSYAKSIKLDTSRILEIPFFTVEDLRIDLTQKLDALEKDKERIFVFVDSIGNAASSKEVEDAREGKSTVDMTRAKILRSLFRIITPYFTVKNVPAIMIAHTYSTIEMYSHEEISGGEGPYYNANNVWIITRVQEKNAENKVEGYTFNINVDKSRFVKEKSKIPVTVYYETGIKKWSGLFEIALDSGHILKGKQGYYLLPGDEKSYRRKELDTKETWDRILSDPTFDQFIKDKYKLSENNLIQE